MQSQNAKENSELQNSMENLKQRQEKISQDLKLELEKAQKSQSDQIQKFLTNFADLLKLQTKQGQRLDDFSGNSKAPSDSPEETSMTNNVSTFIAIPLVCLLTLLNVALVFVCMRKRKNLRLEENKK